MKTEHFPRHILIGLTLEQLFCKSRRFLKVINDRCFVQHNDQRKIINTPMKYKNINIITRFIAINIAPLTAFCNCILFFLIARWGISNCPLLKYISTKIKDEDTKSFLVWCAQPLTTCLVWTILGVNQPHDFKKFLNCPRFTRAISKFSKIHLGNLS